MDDNDNGFKSRKFFLTIGCIVVVTTVSLLGIWFPAIEAILPTFIGGVLGILGLYFGGNVGAKWVIGKTVAQTQQDVQVVPLPVQSTPMMTINPAKTTVVKEEPTGEGV
jgi:hypothetical protein